MSYGRGAGGELEAHVDLVLSLGALADVDEVAVRGTEEVVAVPVALTDLPELLRGNSIAFNNFGPILESTFQGNCRNRVELYLDM